MRSTVLPVETPRNTGRATAARREAPVAAAAWNRIVGALRTVFNFLALNVVLVVACLPIVTVPLAFRAAMVSLERWRLDGEDRVVRTFIDTLRIRPRLATLLGSGLPFVTAAIAAEEVHFFSRGGTVADWVSLGFGVAALLVSLASIGYVLLLAARQPLLAPTELWELSVRLAVRKLPLTAPLFVAEFAAATLLLLLDPPLALVGVPLGLLCLLRSTARLGLRHSHFERLQEG